MSKQLKEMEDNLFQMGDKTNYPNALLGAFTLAGFIYLAARMIFG